MDSMVKEWTVFLDRCLNQRVQADLFDAATAQLHQKSPLPGRKLAALLLKPRSPNASSVDPRVIIYLERLLALKKVDASDALSATFHYSKDRLPKTGDDLEKQQRWCNSPELEELVCHRLQRAFAAEERPVNNTEGLQTLIVVTRWMQAMVTSHTSDTMMQVMTGISQHSINVREALGVLVVGLIENSKILMILSHPAAKDLRKRLAQSLASFIPFLSHNSLGSQSSLEIANRLEMSQKQHELYEKPTTIEGVQSESTNLEVAALQLDAVLDLPLVSTRAGLYVFLNSLLVARPLTDDFTIINYLHSRYKIELQNMAADLITASFDILANAMYRSEPISTIFGLKSFLINKVPILLSQLSGSIYPLTPEISITQALSHIDPHAFPAFSQGFDDILGSNSALSSVRQDFLNACALHGHIATGTVERLLGEQPSQGPPANRYEKKTLLDLCKNNFDKVNAFIDEMENLDGNAGAIVGAITEFIAHLCETQVTMHLKQICNLLSKKPQCLDVMLQFTSPASILRPLCQFLDDWHYDNDQEYQPVYDEFGAILVLIMALVYRYDLSHIDVGISRESFIARLIQHGGHSIAPDDLTEEQGKNLGSWLKGLYDSGNEGLSNDVFASCRPQDFYLIVPTFFSQTVMACSAGVLSHETVKGGLEYLGETFLLPSLIGGLSWMASHALKQTHNDLEAMMKIFEDTILIVPSGGDAQAMHTTIIAMLSSRLEKCFRTLQRRNATRTNIEPLLQAIKPNAQYDRSTSASIHELEQWTAAPSSTLNTALRQTVKQLAQWTTTAAINPNPPSYTHRQIYAASSMLGVYQTVRAIIDEVKAQTEAGNGAAALDIGVSIICAPTVEDSPMPVDWIGSSIPAQAPPRTRMNLREMLKHVFDNAAPLVATDPSSAEAIVRLHRRVEAQLASIGQGSLQPPVISLPNVSINEMQAQTINDDINKAMEDAANASLTNDLELQSIDKKTLEQSMGDLGGAAGLDLSNMGMDANDTIDITGDMNATLGSLPELDLGDMNSMGMDMDMDMDMNMGGGGDDDWGLDFDNM